MFNFELKLLRLLHGKEQTINYSELLLIIKYILHKVKEVKSYMMSIIYYRGVAR